MTEAILDLRLDKLVYGGDCLGRLEDGRVAFIPFGLPGETVRAKVVEEKRGHLRLELLEVLSPSPERITPRCKHFFSPHPKGEGGGVKATCGGCHYQHMSYTAQLRAKEAILRDQLARIGRIENPPIRPIVPCPQEWNYRNHIQFHLSAEEKLGYVALTPSPSLKNGRGEQIIPITECHLLEPALADLWPRLDFEPDCGLERVSLRLGMDDEILLILEGSDPRPPGLEVETGISVAHLSGGDAVVLAGDGQLFMQVLDRRFRVSAGSFFQVNTSMAERMVAHLLANISLTQKDIMLEAYCGVGLFSAFLARHAARLIGVENSPSACEDFTANLDEFENVELYEGAAEEILPALTGQIVNQPGAGRIEYSLCMLVDPPRGGLEQGALDAILACKPRALAYISCDPATLGRDAARLTGAGYNLKQVTPFDLFPQTYHIESISFFEAE